MREPRNSDVLPAWAGEMLKREPEPVANARERIMHRIRAMPVPRTLTAPMRRSRWLRRGLLTPAGSAAAAFFMIAIASLRIGTELVLRQSLENTVRVVGDTIIERVVASRSPGILHDTLRDTLRIVEFVVRGQGIHSASVVGDRDAGQTTALQQVAGQSEWRARLVVPRDALRFAFMINNVQLPSTSLPLSPAPASHDSI